MHVLSGFFFATFPVYTRPCTLTNSEFRILPRQSTETHSIVPWVGAKHMHRNVKMPAFHFHSANVSHADCPGASILLLSMLPLLSRRQHGKAVLLELVLQIAQWPCWEKISQSINWVTKIILKRKLSPTYGYYFWVIQTREQALGKPAIPVHQWGQLPTFIHSEKLKEKRAGGAPTFRWRRAAGMILVSGSLGQTTTINVTSKAGTRVPGILI